MEYYTLGASTMDTRICPAAAAKKPVATATTTTIYDLETRIWSR
jgi:hypothetical protein